MATIDTDIPSLQFEPSSGDDTVHFELLHLPELFERLEREGHHDPTRLHRLNFYAVLINTGSPVTHQLDFSPLPLETNKLALIAAGHTHAFDSLQFLLH